VINGEGTLHHAAADAEAFLSVAVHPCRGNVPVVLVNSVFQNIPTAWGRYFEPLALISFRDSRSTAAYRTQFGGPAHTVHDLTFHCEAPAPRETAVPRGVAIGDSVHRAVTRDLYRLYASLDDAVYLPIRPRTRRLRDPDRLTWKDRFDNLRYRARVDLRAMFEPTYRIVPDAAFKRELGRVGLYVTGRFHGVCFAMMAGTPFRWVASNSHKIEALLSDAGLRAERLQPHGEIGRPDQGDWRFTESETHALQSFLARARDGNGALFDSSPSPSGRTAPSARPRPRRCCCAGPRRPQGPWRRPAAPACGRASVENAGTRPH
jgi:Polysaccharide pyruvyl transferase